METTKRVYSCPEVDIEYTIQFSRRKSMGIDINGVTKEVIVKLPLGQSEATAARLIEQKAGWILKHLDKIEQREDSLNIKEYKDGATHLILGKPHTLRVVTTRENTAEVGDGVITVKTTNPGYVEEIMDGLYDSMARNFLIPICSQMALAFSNRYKVTPSSFEYKKVKGYWGVCTSRGVIRINTELIRADEECIRYIIAHELCHLIHPNHSKRYYELLDFEFPRWRECKRRLQDTISTRR